MLPLLCNARHKVILVSDPAFGAHAAGRAHFRLLWVHGTSPARPVLWLEAVHSDFTLGWTFSTRAWRPAVLAHAAAKAAAMGVPLSVEPSLAAALADAVGTHLGGTRADVALAADRLVLRPSNGVLEASDFLSNKHDWVQLEDEVTPPIKRAVYTPPAAKDEL